MVQHRMVLMINFPFLAHLSRRLISELIIPPVYEVYRGYIVFAFSVCVCVCVNFFFVKDFSGSTVPRILKFGTNIGYDKLYCVVKF